MGGGKEEDYSEDEIIENNNQKVRLQLADDVGEHGNRIINDFRDRNVPAKCDRVRTNCFLSIIAT